MLMYTENDTESHRNIQNINTLPKARQKHENPFNVFKDFKQIKKNQFKQTAFYVDCMALFLLLRATQAN